MLDATCLIDLGFEICDPLACLSGGSRSILELLNSFPCLFNVSPFLPWLIGLAKVSNIQDIQKEFLLNLDFFFSGIQNKLAHIEIFPNTASSEEYLEYNPTNKNTILCVYLLCMYILLPPNKLSCKSLALLNTKGTFNNYVNKNLSILTT